MIDIPPVASTVGELREALQLLRRERAVVMTMGALHEGHLSLIEHARGSADSVIVTIFVNPLQFGPGEDFDSYPRDLDADLGLLAGRGVDVVFAPSIEEMYPGGVPEVTVAAGRMGTVLEGASRPGHFDGVLTVVNKLLQLTSPDIAVFGQKDVQQLLLIRRMIDDFNLPVRVDSVPIVRDEDGLARSSRNIYLDGEQRAQALALSRALDEGRLMAESGGSPSAVVERVHSELALTRGVDIDYVALVDHRTLAEISDDYTGMAILAVAARVGFTRLIDNSFVTFSKDFS